MVNLPVKQLKALEEFERQQVGGSDKKGRCQLLPKPTTWEPKTREEELGQWSQWRDRSWSLEQYLAIQNIKKNVVCFEDDLYKWRKRLRRLMDLKDYGNSLWHVNQLREIGRWVCLTAFCRGHPLARRVPTWLRS